MKNPLISKARRRIAPLPVQLRIRSARTGSYICRCGKGYGSEYDGLCFYCRGMTGFEARQAAQ